MDWSTVVSTRKGMIAGCLINVFFSQRGSKELRREAKNLKQLTTRATQLHEFVLKQILLLERIPIMMAPKGFLFQGHALGATKSHRDS